MRAPLRAHVANHGDMLVHIVGEARPENDAVVEEADTRQVSLLQTLQESVRRFLDHLLVGANACGAIEEYQDGDRSGLGGEKGQLLLEVLLGHFLVGCYFGHFQF